MWPRNPLTLSRRRHVCQLSPGVVLAAVHQSLLLGAGRAARGEDLVAVPEAHQAMTVEGNRAIS